MTDIPILARSARLLPGLPAGLLRPPPGAPLRPQEPALGRVGSLEVRLARDWTEVKLAQRLRYRVFSEELGAIPTGLGALKRRDADEYDPLCDHLLVVDHAAKRKPFRAHVPKVVGTYRLLRQSVAEDNFGFYTAGEFDIGPLLDRHVGTRFVELGRSCVLEPYRTRKTVELLWQGIWAYVQRHRVDAMLGCASLQGTDPDRLAAALSFLHHHARSPEPWRVRALAGRYVAMDRLSREAVDPKAALKALPPLMKAYLRVGATVGDGAVIDRRFGTTDVFVVMPVAEISRRYITYFGPAADRFTA